MGSPGWNVSMVKICLLLCGCPALDMPEWREMTKQTVWQAKQPLQVACISEDIMCWGAWDTTCGHKAKDSTPLNAWRREAWKEEAFNDLPWKDERGPSSIRWTLGLFQRQRWENCWKTGWSTYFYGVLWAHWYHLTFWAVVNQIFQLPGFSVWFLPLCGLCCRWFVQKNPFKIHKLFTNLFNNYGAEKQHKGTQLFCTSGKGAQPLL